MTMPLALKSSDERIADSSTKFRILAPLYGGSFTTDTSVSLPYVLPHEVVQLSEQLRILESSPARVEPVCAHFETCGGCQYQHVDYPEQLLLKREILANLFTANGLTEFPAIQTESAEPYHYRNRVRLRIETDATGSLRAGYSRRASNDFLPVSMCPIAAPVLWQTGETLLHLAATDPLVKSWLKATSELEVFTVPDESKLQLHFFLRSAEAAKRESSSFPGLCARIASATPQLTGASVSLDPELNRRARRAWQGTSWGDAGLSYPAAGGNYWLPRGAFFQVNRFLIDRLVSLVTAGRSGSLGWDLYAGVGLFTRALAQCFKQVVAVEGAEHAATALATLKAPVTAVHSSTLEFLRARVLDRERPSLIVLDPPRAGLGPEAARLLARIGAPEIVYVSCDPTTLTLDLGQLSASYEIVSLTLIDLFPQTFHIETITHLRKRPLATQSD